MRKRFRRLHKPSADLDITTFMNLMVILVPFLLITAVFNQVNILEMNLPPAKNEAAPPQETPELQLEIILRKNELRMNSNPGVLLKSFPLVNGKYDLNGVSQQLQKVKGIYPEVTSITLLLEPDVPYDNLIQMMDTVRMFESSRDGKQLQTELFPDIALGDAPANAAGGR